MAIPFDELKASVALSAIIGQTLQLKRAGREFTACCPFHAEKTPSFTVNDDKQMYHCFGCGAHGDVFDWLKHRGLEAKEAAYHLGYKNGHDVTVLEWQQLPVPWNAPEPDFAGMDHVYEYQDPNGRRTRYIGRIDAAPDHRKRFIPFTWGNLKGQIGWHHRQSNPPRELYRLPDLSVDQHQPVLLVEGEKACDAAREMFPDHACVTWSGGSNAIHANRWDVLKDREVIIWPDNDEPGHKAARELQTILKPIAGKIQTLRVDDLPDKADAADLTTDDPAAWLVEHLPPVERSRILSAAEFMAGFVPPDYVLDGIIQRGRLYALTSPTGHGKTAVALYQGCMIAAGRNIGSVEVTQGAVIFLAGENPDDLRTRLFAACQVYGLKAETLPLYVLPATFPITDEVGEALKAEIDALCLNPVLIVVDTAAAFFPGDNDNDNVQMGNYARTLRTLTTCHGRPAVLTPAHPVKNPDRDNLLPRGGGAFLNEIDGNLTLWASIMGEVTAMHWQGKIRGPDFPPINFALQSVVIRDLKDSKGRPIISIIATLQTDEQAEYSAKAAISDENVVLEMLRRHPGISIRDIALNAGWVSEGGAPYKSKVHRLLGSLKNDKLVVVQRRKWVITAAGEKELEGEK